jgi:hypothetical protein
MGIEVTCDKCSKDTDTIICERCSGSSEPEYCQDAVQDLAKCIALGDRDGAFMALDVLIRDWTNANEVRDWIDIARRAA